MINNIFMPSTNSHHVSRQLVQIPLTLPYCVKFSTTISTSDLGFPPPRAHRLAKFRTRVMSAVHKNVKIIWAYFCSCFVFVFCFFTIPAIDLYLSGRSQTASKTFLQQSTPWKMWGRLERMKLTYSCVVETPGFSLTEHQVESLVILMGLAPLFVRRWCIQQQFFHKIIHWTTFISIYKSVHYHSCR